MRTLYRRIAAGALAIPMVLGGSGIAMADQGIKAPGFYDNTLVNDQLGVLISDGVLVSD